MKNALLLHGTGGSSKGNWFPWLNQKLSQAGYKVWCPDLPGADKPNIERYNKFIFDNSGWEFNSSSVLVGHSSGSIAILGLLQDLPDGVQVDTCYLIGSFKDDLGWDSLKDLFLKPFDFSSIKTKAKKFIFIHSDDDPYCPLEHAKYLAKQLEGELILKKGQKHFSVGTYGEAYRLFPLLLELLLSNEVVSPIMPA